MPSRVANSGGSISQINPPDKSRNQLRAQRPQLGQAAIAGQHELPAFGDQRVDRVLQFLERPLLAGEKLQVVDRQQASRRGTSAGSWASRCRESLRRSRRELLGREIHGRGPRMMPAILAHDRPQQMRLADARRPAKQHRRRLLPAARRQFGRAKRILVAWPDDKRREAQHSRGVPAASAMSCRGNAPSAQPS